jgi:hypothetical protein
LYGAQSTNHGVWRVISAKNPAEYGNSSPTHHGTSFAE